MQLYLDQHHSYGTNITNMKLTLTLLLSSISLICSSQVKELKIAQEKGRIQLEKSRYSNNSSATKSLYVNPFIGSTSNGDSAGHFSAVLASILVFDHKKLESSFLIVSK